MKRIYKINHSADGKEVSIFVIYETPEDFDLERAIHDAASNYFKLRSMLKHGELVDIKYIDFVLNVPNEYCEEQGFTKTVLGEDDVETIDANQLCVSKHDISLQMRDYSLRDCSHKARYDIIEEWN